MTNCGHHPQGEPASVRDALMAEHRVIERVLDATERLIESGQLDEAFLRKALDFFRNFADGCHHAKEEDILFPRLEKAGTPREGGPIGRMLHEHEQGRRLLGLIESNLTEAVAGATEAASNLRRAAREYIGLLRLHIQKEDRVLFVVAEQVLDAEAKASVLEQFDRAESEGDPGKHERYLALADELGALQFTSRAS